LLDVCLERNLISSYKSRLDRKELPQRSARDFIISLIMKWLPKFFGDFITKQAEICSRRANSTARSSLQGMLEGERGRVEFENLLRRLKRPDRSHCGFLCVESEKRIIVYRTIFSMVGSRVHEATIFVSRNKAKTSKGQLNLFL